MKQNEELRPNAPVAGQLNPNDPDFLKALEKWGIVSSGSPLLSGPNAPVYGRLAKKCIFTLFNNRQAAVGDLKHEGVYPSHSTFAGLWAWDSWKHAFGLASISPELAKNSIRAMFDYQDCDGMIPDCIYVDKARNNCRDTKPPLAAWAVEEICKRNGDYSFAEEMFPSLLRYHKWWRQYRDHDGNGLCEYGCTDETLEAARWESGWDNAVRFDHAVLVKNKDHAWSMNQESADLNAYLFLEKHCLSRLATTLKIKTMASQLLDEAATLREQVCGMMWDEATGFFYDIDLATKKPLLVMEPNGWLPLWAGMASSEQARKVRNVILNPAKFNTFVPFPTASADDPAFQPEGYWRGSVWLDQAYFGCHGLRKYGYVTEADDLTLKLFRHAEGLLDEEGSSPIRENYHPLTGKGLGALQFSWSAVSILMMILEYGQALDTRP